jgi:uncharacterized membrane protein
MPGLTDQIIPVLLRWIHVLFGIIWIGHLYFFNFVNVNFEKSIDASMKKPIIPQLRPRALWWFRWGAMITMLSGVIYIIWEQFVAGNQGFSTWFQSGNNMWITFGMLLGLVMWFNVWFVIWPNQKIILTGIATGNKPADFDARVATAGKFSRINTYLSVPMLFGMIGRSHFAIGDISVSTAADGTRITRPDWVPLLVTMAVVTAIGFAVAYHFIWMVGPKVGKEFISPAPAAPPPAPPK